MSDESSTWQSVLDVLDHGRHWGQFSLSRITLDKPDTYCLLGACGKAWSNDPKAPNYDQFWLLSHIEKIVDLAHATGSTRDYHVDPEGACLDVIHWNDRSYRTWEDVEMVLTRLIEQENRHGR